MVLQTRTAYVSPVGSPGSDSSMLAASIRLLERLSNRVNGSFFVVPPTNGRNLARQLSDVHAFIVVRRPPIHVLLAGLYILAMFAITIYLLLSSTK